jgi:oligopeptide/dipeptide ABC transporter ATP-binding protein
MDDHALRSFRARSVAMIFQDPRSHSNPVHTVGHFLTEGMRTLDGIGRHEAERRAIELLASVHIDQPDRAMRQYPHELSGGMLQRVMIAAALASRPRLLLADEPTTALDVTVQAEVMAILNRLRSEAGLAMIFVTHDLELAAATCDRTAVMYAGSIVEAQHSSSLHVSPQHPYTRALLAARPDIDKRTDRLRVIPGQPISAFEAGDGCAFAPRCDRAVARCEQDQPVLIGSPHSQVACWAAGVGDG